MEQITYELRSISKEFFHLNDDPVTHMLGKNHNLDLVKEWKTTHEKSNPDEKYVIHKVVRTVVE